MIEKMSSSTESDDADSSLSYSSMLGPQVSELLIEHGIRKSKQSAWTSDLLSLGTRTTRSKLQGKTPFKDEEIETILNRIGYTYQGLHGIKKLLPTESLTPQRNVAPQYAQTTVVFDGQNHFCTLLLSQDPTIDISRQRKVAIKKDDGTFEIVQIDNAPDNCEKLAIKTIEIPEPYAIRQLQEYLAIISKTKSDGEAVQETLGNGGFRTKLFNMGDLRIPFTPKEQFDAFVTIWPGRISMDYMDLMTHLKHSFPEIPIVISATDLHATSDLFTFADRLNSEVILRNQHPFIATRTILRAIKASERL